jgi:hypothetical protein
LGIQGRGRLRFSGERLHEIALWRMKDDTLIGDRAVLDADT